MTSSPPRSKPRRVMAWMRMLLGLGILWWVFDRISTDELLTVLRDSVSQWPWWVIGILMTLFGLLAAAVRWHSLLAVQGVTFQPLRVFRIFFIGQFFNAFLPGSCGGDVVRAYYIFQETQLKRTEAVSTVLVDRGIGLLTVVTFACLMMAWRLPVLIQQEWAQVGALIMLALLVGIAAALFVIFRKNLFEHSRLFQRMETGTVLGTIFRRVYNAFYVYRDHPAVLRQAVVYSFINLAALTLACYAFGQSLGVPVALIDYFTLFPVITALSAIPITPGALGVREGLFAELFRFAGARQVQAVPLSLMVYAGGLFWSLIGGFVFVSYSSSYGTSLQKEWQALKAEHRRHQAMP